MNTKKRWETPQQIKPKILHATMTPSLAFSNTKMSIQRALKSLKEYDERQTYLLMVRDYAIEIRYSEYEREVVKN